MSEDFEKNIPEDFSDEEDVTLIELEGVRYEIIDTVNRDGKVYIAISPFDDDVSGIEDESGDFTILEVSDDPDDENGCILKTIDDEELYSEIGDLFIEKFAEEDE